MPANESRRVRQQVARSAQHAGLGGSDVGDDPREAESAQDLEPLAHAPCRRREDHKVHAVAGQPRRGAEAVGQRTIVDDAVLDRVLERNRIQIDAHHARAAIEPLDRGGKGAADQPHTDDGDAPDVARRHHSTPKCLPSRTMSGSILPIISAKSAGVSD